MIIQFKQNVGHYAVITIKEDISGHIVQNCMWTKYVNIILIVLGFFLANNFTKLLFKY